MSLNFTKLQYVDGETVIPASNLNEIQDAILDLDSNKVEKEPGKGLSTNDYSDTDKSKVDTALQYVPDTYRTAAAQDEIDEAQNAEIADLKSAVKKKAPAIYDTASGAIASFEDGADGMPLKSLTVNIEPVQDLHGYDNPWPAGGGANIFNEQLEAGQYSVSSGEKSTNGNTLRSVDFIPVIAGNTYRYTQANGAWILFYDSNKQYLSGEHKNVYGGATDNAVFTVPNGASYITFYTATAYGTTYKNDISINYPDTVTTYQPYSNICPITGWTGCNVARTGKNRLSKDGIFQGAINADGTVKSSDTTRCYSAFVKIEPGLKYTFSCETGIIVRAIHTYKRRSQTGGSWNGRILTATNSTTFTAGADDNYCRAMYCKADYNAKITPTEITSPQMENGSATGYEEYSGDTYPITFPSEAGTVYGGTLNLVNGMLKAFPYYASYNGEMLVGPWVSSMDVYAPGTNPTIGAQVVDLGGAVTEYDLSDIPEITTLLGTNNIWADTGDVIAEYPADTKLYIQKINAPTDNDMIADTQIDSGKYFLINNSLYLSTTTIPPGDPIKPGTNCQKTNLAAALNALNT